MKKLYLSSFFVLGIFAIADAQSFYAVRRERDLIFTFGTGNSSYFGELKDSKKFFDPKFNINTGLQLYFTNRISARAEVTWFQLSGTDATSDDASRRRRNLSFNSNNIEMSVTGAINFFPNGNRYYRRPHFNLYAFGGIGGLYFNPKSNYEGKSVALEPLHTEGVSYSRFTLVIPFGLGARIMMGPNMNLAIEGGYRKTFTDYLDDVSTVYPDPSKLTSPAAVALSNRYVDDNGNPDPGRAKPGDQRGNPGSKDGYFLLNAKIEYYIPGDFQIFGAGGQKRYGSFNKRRSSSMYRYNKRGKLKR
jgi:Domain of unknown function (DUF6089)